MKVRLVTCHSDLNLNRPLNFKKREFLFGNLFPVLHLTSNDVIDFLNLILDSIDRVVISTND